MSVMTRPADGTGPPEDPPHPPEPPDLPDPPGPRGPVGRRPVVVAGLAVLAIIAIFIAVSWTHAPWRDFVHRKPPSYVELTVVGPQALPSTFLAGEPVSFAFSVKNVDQSGTRRNVTWVTSVRDTVTGHSDAVNHGSAVVEAGSTKTVSEQVSIDSTHRTEVVVRLGTGEQIDFYVSPQAAAGGG